MQKKQSFSKIKTCIFLFLFLASPWPALSSQSQFLGDWRKAFIECVRIESLSPNLMIRNLTLFSLASHDCLNQLEPRFETYLQYDQKPPSEPELRAVLAGCGWTLAKTLHPARLSAFADLSAFARDRNCSASIKASFLFGSETAKRILQNRRDDGSSTTITYLARSSPGLWRRTPSFYRPPEQPHWRKVRLFALPERENFLPPPPPEPHSETIFQALREVKEVGSKKSQIRTKEQSFIAEFWKDFSYSQTPPGHWNKIASFVSKSLKNDLWEEAQLYALLNVAMADSGIIAWESKYKYHLWRPVHAIRLADQFPETRSLANSTWEPLLESPPHPEYVSGHSSFSGAAAEILRRIAGTDQLKFRVDSDRFPGQFRSFESFSSCTKEIAQSRLYGGIHYSFSNQTGIETGQRIAGFVFENKFKALTIK
jgi:hypothetical protein